MKRWKGVRLVISDLLGTSNVIETEPENYNSFRPPFKHFYNGSFANNYVKVQTEDENGESVVMCYDLSKNVFISPEDSEKEVLNESN